MPATNGQAAANGNANGHADIPDVSIALSPCDVASVPAHLQQIHKLGESFVSGNDGARTELLESARNLVRALETPRETMIKHCWAQPSAFTALATGLELGLFKVMYRDGASSKKTVDLAKEVGADPRLIARLLRHLGSMGYVTETGPDEYKPTNFTAAVNIPIIGDGYPCISGALVGALYKFPEYMRKTQYKEPNSATDGPFQYALDTPLNMFQYVQAHPPHGEQFNHHMGGYRQGRDSWMDAGFYPVNERLIKGAEASDGAVFLVDIGGSIGHDIDEFRRKHPQAPGRLILEDLPTVIGQIQTLDVSIERLPHDFHEEQPIKGSRAYYMHSVLHDWPDAVCSKILARITAAMKPGYSKLLINENVIPSTKADWQTTALDIMMLTLFASRERTEKDWRALLEPAGLKICHIYSTKNGVESLIECELA